MRDDSTMPSPQRPESVWRAYARSHRGALVGLVTMLVVASLVPLLGPQLLRRFVDQAAAGTAERHLIGTAIAYLVVAVSAHGLALVAAYVASRVAWTATNQLREDLADHALSLDMSFHGSHSPGEMIERIDGDITLLAEFTSRFLFHAVRGALLLVGTIAFVLWEDVRIGLLLLFFVALAAVVVVRFQRRALPLATAEREARAQVTGFIEERVAGSDDIRALGAGHHSMRRLFDVCRGAYLAALRWNTVAGGMLAGANFVFALGTAVTVAAGIVLLRRGDMTAGTVILLFQYATMVRQPVEQIVFQFKEFQAAAAGAARVAELLAITPRIQDAPDGLPLPATGPLTVSMERVTFAYPGDDDVLHEVDLVLPAGRSIGLVGRTGSGKTTIGRLLLRLYDPTDGRIVLDGVDLPDIAIDHLRRRVRLVSQSVELFSASLRDNLTLFGDDVVDGRLVEVLGEVGLGPWLQSLPTGLDTTLGVGGRGVSAGEAQLIALARVFLADPGLVILDEPTSRLDPATEEMVERAIGRLLEGRSAVVIAHRLSSLRRVDEIVVLDHGRIVERGPRADLEADRSSRFGRLLALSLASPS